MITTPNGGAKSRYQTHHVHRREDPRNPLFRKTCFHVRIIEDVPGIAKGGEGMAPDLAEDQKNHVYQGDTPKRLRGYETCFSHGYEVPVFLFLKDGIFPDSRFLQAIFHGRGQDPESIRDAP